MSLEDAEAMAESITLEYRADEACLVSMTWSKSVMRFTCLWTSLQKSMVGGCAAAGRNLHPEKLVGKAYAWKDSHSPSSDHRPDDDRYGVVPAKVGISLTAGRTRLMSEDAAMNQSDCRWWCAMKARCLHEPAGAFASFRNSAARRSLQDMVLECNPMRISTAALGDRPPTCKSLRHHFRSLPWKAEVAMSGCGNKSIP